MISLSSEISLISILFWLQCPVFVKQYMFSLCMYLCVCVCVYIYIYIYIYTYTYEGLPHGSAVKNPLANAGDVGSVSGSGRSIGEGNGNPLKYSCLGNSMDRKSLVGYSPWGCKESDMT